MFEAKAFVRATKLIAIAGALSSAVGCTVRGRGTTDVEPVSTAEVTSAPVVDYEAYPHTVYAGRTVYYVHDRWGYPDRGRWVYYRQEPPPLLRYRTRVETAPPPPPASQPTTPRTVQPRPSSAHPTTRVR
jgi:hypothetical protein